MQRSSRVIQVRRVDKLGTLCRSCTSGRPTSRTTRTRSTCWSNSSITTTSETTSTSSSACESPYPLPHSVYPEEHLGVHAVDPRRKPLREQRRPRLLRADGRLYLRPVPGAGGEQPLGLENNQYLPQVRLPEEREPGRDSLQQPGHQHLQLHDLNR